MVKRLKKSAEALMSDVCTVYEKKAVSVDGRTEFVIWKKYENVPCRLSAKAYLFGEKTASDKENLAEAGQSVKLFLPPEYEIDAGSLIEVTHLGRSETYKRSGQMKRYLSHIEIMAEKAHDWA